MIDGVGRRASVSTPFPLRANITGMRVAIMHGVRYHNAGPSGRAPSGGHSLSRRV